MRLSSAKLESRPPAAKRLEYGRGLESLRNGIARLFADRTAAHALSGNASAARAVRRTAPGKDPHSARYDDHGPMLVSLGGTRYLRQQAGH